jgi:lipid II:glycine glycyltransferase (peptidoglycan interpeptide bridge formation enzyme)
VKRFDLWLQTMDDLLIPLSQSEAFEKTCQSLRLSVQRFETSRGTCLVQSRKLPLLGRINLISRGPIVREPDAAQELVLCARAKTRGPLFVNANAAPLEVGGFRLISGAELALIHLSKPNEMRARMGQKWRNQLRKAERSDLTIVNQALDAERHKWFLAAEAEQQRLQRYSSYPAGFLLAYAAANKGEARVFTAQLQGQPVAAMLMLRHGTMATYQAGVTTPEGRRYCAHNLLLWQMMCDHERRGGTILDLGRADLSPGLRRFKLGSGAITEKLSGTYWMPSWRMKRSRRTQSVTAAI